MKLSVRPKLSGNNAQRRPTLATVAEASGFSVSAVSLVLNDRPLARSLSADTRKRIQQAAAALNYRPDAAARSLRSRRSQLVGVMVFDIADPYCTLILQGIQATLQPAGLLPIIMDVHNQSDQFERFLGLAVERQVEGLIVVANWLFVEIDTLRRFERNGIPAALVGREFPSSVISSVLIDNEEGGRLAMEHLLELGHRNVAVIRGPRQLQDSDRRWRGMQIAARAAGVRLDPQLVVQMPESADPLQGHVAGADATRELLRRGKPFTGLLAFDDLTASGALRALYEAGCRVPEDISIVGFDDIPQAMLNTPSLTTVSQHLRQMGEVATEHLLGLIAAAQDNGSSAAKPAKAFIRLHPPALVRRESTGPVPKIAVGTPKVLRG